MVSAVYMFPQEDDAFTPDKLQQAVHLNGGILIVLQLLVLQQKV